MPCDPQTLITDGKCFSGACLTPDQQRIAMLQLLCQIAEAGGGGGGGVTSIIAGSGISVDQATGAVTITATGGGGGGLQNVTRAQRLALTPSVGDQVFDTTMNAAMTWDGNLWAVAPGAPLIVGAGTTPILATYINGAARFQGYGTPYLYGGLGSTNAFRLNNGNGINGVVDLCPLAATITEFNNQANPITQFYANGCSLLAYLTINAPLTALDISGCTALLELTISSILISSGIDFTAFPSLTLLNISGSVNVPSITLGATVGDVGATGCSSLTTVTTPVTFAPSVVFGFQFNGCALTQQSVDDILDALDIASPNNADLSGGTSSAPSVSGLARKAALILAGWTVTTN